MAILQFAMINIDIFMLILSHVEKLNKCSFRAVIDFVVDEIHRWLQNALEEDSTLVAQSLCFVTYRLDYGHTSGVSEKLLQSPKIWLVNKMLENRIMKHFLLR